MPGQAEQVQRLEIQVENGLGLIRLDDYLFARFGTLSRMYLRDLVRTNQVLVNGEFSNIGVKLRANDFIEISVDMSRGTAMQPEDIPLEIVWEDDAFLVVNKPAGMLVHPTHRDKNGTLLNALTHHLNKENFPQTREDGKEYKPNEPPRLPIKNTAIHPSFVRRGAFPVVRPGLVHRLDRETSGLMVVAKSVEVHRKLTREFMKKRVEKRYVALVDGVISSDEGTIEAPIGRFAEKKIWDVKLDGKISVTHYRVLQRFDDSTLVELEPVTGRTNQLRIHCASVGHPIVGDVQRGGSNSSRLCLHAHKLAFRHPIINRRTEFKTPIPDDLLCS
jgi:23S rRNA pseudouridine1911/1915/1917 synthase